MLRSVEKSNVETPYFYFPELFCDLFHKVYVNETENDIKAMIKRLKVFACCGVQ